MGALISYIGGNRHVKDMPAGVNGCSHFPGIDNACIGHIESCPNINGCRKDCINCVHIRTSRFEHLNRVLDRTQSGLPK